MSLQKLQLVLCCIILFSVRVWDVNICCFTGYRVVLDINYVFSPPSATFYFVVRKERDKVFLLHPMLLLSNKYFELNLAGLWVFGCIVCVCNQALGTQFQESHSEIRSSLQEQQIVFWFQLKFINGEISKYLRLF